MAAAAEAILIDERAQPERVDAATRDEEIAQLAYSNWEAFGCPCDSDEENWGWAAEEWERRRATPA